MCNGESGSKWSSTADRCVAASAVCFCDAVQQTTCYVAYWDPIEIEQPTINDILAMQALKSAVLWWDPGVDENQTLVKEVGGNWYMDGLAKDDRISKINGETVTEEMLENLGSLSYPAALTVIRGSEELIISVT